jgi:hypothetical protein
MFKLMPQDTAGPGRYPSRTCDVQGCPFFTRERKPYCPEHILTHATYPRALASILESVEQEIETVGRCGAKAVRLTGLVVEEILAGIATHGRLTWPRLIKDHVAFLNGVPEPVSNAYLDCLKAYGLVDITQTQRGCEVVALSVKGFTILRGGRR